MHLFPVLDVRIDDYAKLALVELGLGFCARTVPNLCTSSTVSRKEYSAGRLKVYVYDSPVYGVGRSSRRKRG